MKIIISLTVENLGLLLFYIYIHRAVKRINSSGFGFRAKRSESKKLWSKWARKIANLIPQTNQKNPLTRAVKRASPNGFGLTLTGFGLNGPGQKSSGLNGPGKLRT